MRTISFGILLLLISSTVNAQTLQGQAVAKTNEYFAQPKKEYSFIISYLLPVGAFGSDFVDAGGANEESLMKSLQGDAGGVGAKGGYELDVSEYCYYNKQPVQTIGGLKLS